MWNPFRKKTLSVPMPSVEKQLSLAIKSISAPQATPTWKLRATGRNDWNVNTAVDEGYNASAIVYACIEKRAKLLASVPWKAATVNSKGEIEFKPDSPLQQLVDRPNPDQSWYELIYNGSQSLDLAGNAFISKIKAGARSFPVELWYLPPAPMKIAPGNERLVNYYEYGSSKRRIESDDMIMLRMPNPSSLVFGMPVLMSAGRPTDIDREAGIWQKVSLENRGAADVNIKLPEGATQEQVDQVKASYKEQQTGPANARKALISNADIQQLGQTAVEMDFVASRRSVWTEICSVFGMSLANIGQTEDVNLANADAMNKALWENTIIPQLELLKRQLDRGLAADFGPEWRLIPDTTNIKALQENRGELLEAATKLFAMGVPFAEINRKLEIGVEDFTGSEISYLPSGLIPASFNLEDNTPPEGAE